jgi:hypothetical protein
MHQAEHGQEQIEAVARQQVVADVGELPVPVQHLLTLRPQRRGVLRAEDFRGHARLAVPLRELGPQARRECTVPEVVVALPPVQRRHIGPRRKRGRIGQIEDREAVRRVERQPERLDRQPRGVHVLQALAVGVPDLVEVPALFAQARPAEESGPDQAQEVRRLRLQPAPASLLAQPAQVRHAAARHEPVHDIDLRRIEADEDDRRVVAHRGLGSTASRRRTRASAGGTRSASAP